MGFSPKESIMHLNTSQSPVIFSLSLSRRTTVEPNRLFSFHAESNTQSQSRDSSHKSSKILPTSARDPLLASPLSMRWHDLLSQVDPDHKRQKLTFFLFFFQIHGQRVGIKWNRIESVGIGRFQPIYFLKTVPICSQ